MSSSRPAGWGAYEKAQRHRALEESRRIVQLDANETFTYKRPKQQPPTQTVQQVQTQPQNTPIPASTQSVTVVASPPPVASAPTAAPHATPVPSSVEPSEPDEMESTPLTSTGANIKSPTSSSNANGGGGSGGGNSPILCSVLVELFEMVNAAPKAYGPKGVTLQRISNGNVTTPAAGGGGEMAFQLMVYAPVSKKIEFTVDIVTNFSLTVLPDRFVAFDDPQTGRSWCLKFGNHEDSFDFLRSFALLNEIRTSSNFSKGGCSRGISKQDLSVGTNEGPQIQIGDQIKCKYSVYAYDGTQPFAIGRILYSLRESAKFIVGAGDMMPFVEESLIGLRKRSTRLLIIPPILANVINENAEWGPHVRANTTLIVECTISNIRSSIPVEDETTTTNQNQNQEKSNGNEPNLVQANGNNEETPNIQQQQQPQQQQPQSSTPQQSQHSTPYHLQSHPSTNPFPGAATPNQPTAASTTTATVATPIDEERGGVYNPTSAAHAGLDLKTRMALLAGASHPNGAMTANTSSPVTGPIPRRESLGPSTLAPSSSSSCGELESFLSELSLLDLLPNFEREGVRLFELFQLDSEELKQLVPLMGPRRRIMTKIQQAKEQNQQPTHTSQHQQQQQHTSTQQHQTYKHQQHHPVSSTSSPNRVPSAAPSTTSSSSFGSGSKSVAVGGVRSRFLSDADTDPVPSYSNPSTSSSSSSSSSSNPLPTTQSQLDALLFQEYERGKSETIHLAKSKISDMKDVANIKFQSLQQQLDEQQRLKEQDRTTAREVVQRLREDLRTVTSERDSFAQSVSILTQEKDAIQDKTQKYIAQMRDKYNATNEQSKKVWLDERREEEQHQLRTTMESLYAMLQSKIRTKDLYEGEEILGMVKAAVKNVIKQQQQQA